MPTIKTYTNVTLDKAHEILKSAEQHGATVTGNDQAGSVVGSGVNMEYQFDAASSTLHLTLESKPFFLSADRVFTMLEENTGLKP